MCLFSGAIIAIKNKDFDPTREIKEKNCRECCADKKKRIELEEAIAKLEKALKDTKKAPSPDNKKEIATTVIDSHKKTLKKFNDEIKKYMCYRCAKKVDDNGSGFSPLGS